MSKLFKVIILFSVFIAVLFAGVGFSGDLRPLELPSQKYGGAAQQNTETPTKTQPAVDESVYTDFKMKIKDMSKQDKINLQESFREKRETAIKKENWDEVKYYEKLIEILGK